MKDYERYMSRQHMSETGMAKLMKLETERPKRGEQVRTPRPGRSGWLKYAAVAACLILVVGLLTPPALRGIGQLLQGKEEELFFHEVDSVPFTDQAIAGGIPLTAMEPADAAEIFGCAPDDFVGLLETVGLSKFDMEYYAVDMAHYPLGVAPQGNDGYRFLMKGSYISPREKPENWDEISETDWEMWKGVSNFFPGNDVWLEIYEGHSYQDEADWKALEPQTFHGCQVTAAYDESNYHAAAAFDLESGGKTYGVLYSAVTYGEANAKELVTKMVRYLTTNGLFVEDRGTPQVKTTGFYRMETGDRDHEMIRLVPPSLHFDGEGCTFFQSVLSSYSGRGVYTVEGGRVTVRNDKDTYVFDILDENTLRFVGAESSEPERYKLGTGEEATPTVTDGALFRWQEGEESLVFNRVEKVLPQVNSPYDMELTGRLDVSDEETEMLLQAGPEDLGWTGLEVAGSSWPLDGHYYFSFDGMDATVDPTCSVSLRLMPNMTDFQAYTAGEVRDWNSLEVSVINGHAVTAMSGKSYTPNFSCAAAAFVVEDIVCDYGVYYAVEHEDRATAEDMVTKLVDYMTGHSVFTEMYGSHGGAEVLSLEYAELDKPYAEVDFYKALEKNDFRDLTAEEVAKVFPASAGEAGVNYRWTGTAWFQDDGNLRAVILTGDAMDGTGTVLLTTSQEEELTFARNQFKKNGKTTYFGADNAKYVYGADLVRCFWVNEPGSLNNAPGRYDCYVQWKLTGSPLYSQLQVIVPEGSLAENESFATRWFDTVNKTGLWFQTGNVNGKDIWKLPGTDGSTLRDYASLEDLRAAVDEKFLPYLPKTLMDHDEFRGIWRRNSGEYEAVDVSWHKPWVANTRFSYSGCVDVRWPTVAMGLPEVTDINDRESYDFRLHPGLDMPEPGRGGFESEFYETLDLPTFRAGDASLDLVESRIYQDPEGQVEGYPEATAVCRFQLLHDNGVVVYYQFQGMTAEEIWATVRETIDNTWVTADELPGLFYLEGAGNYPYLNLGNTGYAYSWWRGEDSCRSGSYAVEDGKVRCRQSGKTYVFETVDENTLRFVGAESDALDYLDADRATRTLPDGAVFRRDDAQLGTHHPEPEHHAEPTHHPEPEHHVETTHHPEPTHHSNHH